MILSIPFLATNPDQIPYFDKDYGNQGVEAVLFNYRDLEDDNWLPVWKTIEKLVPIFGAQNLTFHFPVNNSDYVDNCFVKNKLIEALSRATDLNLSGIVVHSNRIRNISEWSTINLMSERNKVLDTLAHIRNRVQSKTWLALENMPVMDNYGKEIDPLFVFPQDFKNIPFDLGIVWDFCHYTNSMAAVDAVREGKQKKIYYPNYQETFLEDFLSLQNKIKHIHFSAFYNLSNPDTEEICCEGVLPKESTMGEPIYKQAVKLIKRIERPDMHVVFEVQEQDYTQRQNAVSIIDWFKKEWDHA
ncbi:MAG: hypothetical protein C0425_10070 [Chlorobiaceae bacterium]|nr:hypothetical protein [Chlorobiaceae bacterium]